MSKQASLHTPGPLPHKAYYQAEAVEKNAWLAPGFTGEYYAVPFLLPGQKETTKVLEKTLAYLYLVALMALVMVMVPLVVLARCIREKKAGEGTTSQLIIGFIPRVLLYWLSLGMGFITVPTLLLLNLGHFFFLLLQGGKRRFLF